MDLGDYLEKFVALIQIAEKNGVRFYESEDIEDTATQIGLPQIQDIFLDAPEDEDEMISPSQVGKQVTSVNWNDLDTDVKSELKKAARDRALAIMFFMNSNENKYAVYKQDCHNAMAKGRDEYPTTLIEAHTELEDYKFNPRLYQTKNTNMHARTKFSGHQFLVKADTEDSAEEKRKWRPKGDYICHNCDRKNQCMAYDCPHLTD